MKSTIIIFLLTLFSMHSTEGFSQGQQIGANGTAGYFSQIMNICNGSGIKKTADTLANNDTGYTYSWVGSGLDAAIELTAQRIGTVAVTTATVTCWGVNNNGKALTPAQVATITGTVYSHQLTGNTTYCTDCMGASSTTIPASTGTHYSCQFPNSKGAMFDNWIMRAVTVGTAQAVYSAKIITQR